MKVIVGLGNPGKKFENTRHNTGFLVIDRLAEIKKCSLREFSSKKRNWKLRKKLKAKTLETNNFILVKPQTYMNSSGEVIKKIPQYLNISISQFLKNLYVVHDELDLSLGEYKIQFGRGAAGHKGVESVIRELGTKDFWRVRVGIGPSNKAEEQFVLEKFGKEEKEVLEKVIEKAIEDLISRLV